MHNTHLKVIRSHDNKHKNKSLIMEEESFCPLTNDDLMSEFFPELYSQGQHHQQEFLCEFDDIVSTKDNNMYASANDEPKNESLFSTKLLINNYETTTNKDVTLDYGTTQIVDHDDNDNNNNDDDDEAVSNNIATSHHNRKAECTDALSNDNIFAKKEKQQHC